MLFAALVACGCKSTPQTAAEKAEASDDTMKLEYAPLVPEVEWDKLNGLQKTTAAIAIVPGSILSAGYNAYVWVVN